MAGDCGSITVKQDGIDVVLELKGPHGETLTTIDSPHYRRGIESLFFRASNSGRFLIEVRSAADEGANGRYEIALDLLSNVSSDDRRRFEAGLASTEAGRLYSEGSPESLRPAFEAYEAAAALWQETGQRYEEARNLHSAAEIARQLGDARPALELFRQSERLWLALGADDMRALALNSIGLCHWRLDEPEPGRRSLERSWALHQKLGHRFEAAQALGNQCLITHSEGHLRRALECYQRALEQFQNLDAQESIATQLNNMGFAYFSLGEPQAAVEHYHRSLELRRARGDRAGEAQILNNLAVVYRNLGEYQKALTHYGQVRELLASSSDRSRRASVLSNVGVAYLNLGAFDRAAPQLEEALELRRELEDRRGEVATLNSLGHLHLKRGDLGQADAAHRRALTLAREIENRPYEAISHTALGRVALAAGDPRRAVAELDHAVALLHETGDRYRLAVALLRRGEALLTLAEPAAALASLTPAAETYLALGDRAGEAETLVALARAHRQMGRTEEGRGYAESALDIVESLRTTFGNPDLRATFLATRRQAYELMIEFLMDRHVADPGGNHHLQALAISERSRARSLLDVLPEGGRLAPESPGSSLYLRRQSLLRRLNAKAERSLRLRRRANRESPVAAQLELELQSVLAELDNVEEELRRVSPRFSAVNRPRTLDEEEIRNLLDSDTVLLEYFLGEERSFLWAVSLDSTKVFELPPRSEIEGLTRSLHRHLSTLDPGGFDQERRTAAELSRAVLEPAAAFLAAPRLAIVADGGLHYIPFAALPVPIGSPRSGSGLPFLLQEYEVVHLPSASALAWQRQAADRTPAPRLAAVVADPVFDPRDARLAPPPSKTSGLAAAGTAAQGTAHPRSDGAWRSTAARSGLDRLPLSREEAVAIAALAPPGEVRTWLDFAARRSALTGEALADFRVLHFATHGMVDTERPELSGLALSGVDEHGQAQDGMLRLHDIYDLRLNADLVVLSGCRTALGKEVRGEGLMGLTRAFMFAGALRVVASLWWVQDRTTADLMTRLYEQMWRHSSRPAAALRSAQLALLETRRWRDPFYWSAFVHQGDWR